MTNFKATPVKSQGLIKRAQIHSSPSKLGAGNTFPEAEWDGSYIQKRFHSGRTDQRLGHHDRIGASGLGPYHFHHTLGPHMPCCRGASGRGESIIDLFRSYGGTAWTTRHSSSGNTTFSFHASIELEPLRRYFALEIRSTPAESGFFIAANQERTHVAPFFGALLNPQMSRREDSPWDGAIGGFDWLVNAERFHELVEQHTGLTRPSLLHPMMENLASDTTITIDDRRRNTMVTIGNAMLESGYEPAFVAGMLASVQEEGNFGQFEGAGNQPYLQYFINNHNYVDRFSWRHIYSESENAAEYDTLQQIYDMVNNSGQANIFGLGSIQRTNTPRFLSLIRIYGEKAGGMNRRITTRAQVIEAENELLVRELGGEGNHTGGGGVPWGSDLLNIWRDRNPNNLDTVAGARDAGTLISRSFLRPNDPTGSVANRRADNAENIFRIMML